MILPISLISHNLFLCVLHLVYLWMDLKVIVVKIASNWSVCDCIQGRLDEGMNKQERRPIARENESRRCKTKAREHKGKHGANREPRRRSLSPSRLWLWSGPASLAWVLSSRCSSRPRIHKVALQVSIAIPVVTMAKMARVGRSWFFVVTINLLVVERVGSQGRCLGHSHDDRDYDQDLPAQSIPWSPIAHPSHEEQRDARNLKGSLVEL